MPFPKLGDSQDAVIDLLEIIAHNTGGLDGESGDHISIEQNIEQGETGDGDPTYFTTGTVGAEVTDEWEDLPFGFNAKTVNLRFDDDILLAFNNPHERGSWIIPLNADESPFTIGNAHRGIDTDEIWLKQQDSATTTPTAHIIAYK